MHCPKTMAVTDCEGKEEIQNNMNESIFYTVK